MSTTGTTPFPIVAKTVSMNPQPDGVWMKASIIIPTKDRWEKLNKSLKAIKKNTSVTHEVIIIFDGDPKNFKKMVKKKEENYKIICNNPAREYWYCVNQGCFISEGEYLIYLADDVRPRKNWLKNSITLYEKTFEDGIGLLGFQSNIGEGFTHAPHGMVSRKFVMMKGGFLFPTCYKHYFNDTELSLRMQKVGKYIHNPKVVINHDHKSADKKFMDKVYSESFKNHFKNDEIQFHLRNPELVAGLFLIKGDRQVPFAYGQWWYPEKTPKEAKAT